MNDLDILLKLQEIDAKIFRILKEMDAAPGKIEKLQHTLSEKTAAVKRREDELKKIQLKHKEKEIELAAKEENIKKQQLQLYQVKSNKDYNLLRQEIEKAKADSSVLEEEILTLLEKIDTVKAALAGEKEISAQEESRVAREKREIETQIAQLRQETETLNMQRKQTLAFGLKPEVLQLYERILENKEELAVVPVKNGTCQGCFMAIRPQVVSELQLGMLLTCENCARILYAADD